MKAIFLKEIKSYFKTMFGWIYLAAYTFFASLYFIINHISYGSPYISESLQAMVIVVIFILPLLTMRILAEEKKQKTDQFLITAPISLVKVIFGKFFALCAIMLASTIIISGGVGVICIYGSVPVGETIISLIGFFLFGCECIAIGMFLSSITEHQFLAAIFTYAVYIFTLLGPGFCQYVFGADKIISKIFSAADIYKPFNGLMTGIVDLNDLLYIFSVIAIFLILSYKVFARNSVQLSAMGKNRFFISSILPFVIIAGIVGLNIGCTYIPTKYTEYDFTRNKWFSITDDTKELLNGLDQDVTIYVIASKDTVDDTIKHYLDSYDSESKHVKIEYRPTTEYPDFYTQYMDSRPYSSTLIVTLGEEFTVIDYNKMFDYTFNGSEYSITGVDVEGQITSAISSMLAGDNKPHIYLVKGHDELTLPTYTADMFKKANFGFTEVYLYQEGVPENCDMLIVNAPQSDFSEDEIKAIKDYINNGGKVLLTASASPDASGCPNYDSFIEEYGVSLTEGYIIEADYKNMYSMQEPTAIVLSTADSSPFTLSGDKKCIIDVSKGFEYDEENLPEGVSVSDIFVTSNDSYEKKVGNKIQKTDEDKEGPFSIGVYILKRNDNTAGGIAYIGSPLFLVSEYDNAVSHGNSDLVVAICKRLIDKETASTIPAKSFTYEFIHVSPAMTIFYVVICCLVIPASLLIAGIVIMIIRRRK